MTSSVVAYTGNDVIINGVTLNSIDDSGCIWAISDIEGWHGLPEATAPENARSQQEDGSTAVAGRYLSRKLKITGRILPGHTNPSGQAFTVAARNMFNRALNLIRTQGVLQVNETPPQIAYVQITGRPLVKFTKANDVLEFEIDLRASDPRKYSIEETTRSTTAYLGNVGRSYDKIYDYAYGTDTDSGLISAYNEGTYNTYGKIIVHGPVINPTIEHVNTNSMLRFNLTIVEGDYLEIDLATHTILLNGTGNRRGTLLPASTWFTLAPGENLIRFNGQQSPLPQDATLDRTNLVLNPNATSGSSQGWIAKAAGDTVSVVTLPGSPGNNVFFVTSATTNGNPAWGFETAASARPTVQPNNVYALSLDIRLRTQGDANVQYTPAFVTANINYYDNGGTLLATHEGTAFACPSDRYVRISAVAKAPSGATKASLMVRPASYQEGSATIRNPYGVLFDNVMFERVVLAGRRSTNIIINGDQTPNSTGWYRVNTTGSNPIDDFNEREANRLDRPAVETPYTYEELLSDWYAHANQTGDTLLTHKNGFKYINTGSYSPSIPYTFSANVRSTVDQIWSIKVQALTAGNVPISGSDGSAYLIKGIPTFVSANQWARISTQVAIPSGAASVVVHIAPADGDIYAVNTVVNPSFEHRAEDETAYQAQTYQDDYFRTAQVTYPMGTNVALYPNGRYVSSFPSPNWAAGGYGTGGAGTIASQSTGGLNNGYSVRKAWTTAPSSPATQTDLGIQYTSTYAHGYSFGRVRPPVSVRAWVVPSKASNHQIAVEFLDAASTVVSTYVSPPVALTTAGGNIIIENLQTGTLNWNTLRLRIGPYAAGFTPAIGDAFTVSGINVQYASKSLPYFDGSTTNTWDTQYRYSNTNGGPHLRESTGQKKYRENRVTNPRAFSASTGWTYSNGTTGASTLSTVTNEVGPTDLFGFRRATITTADTGGNAGWQYSQSGTETGSLGDKAMMSLWVRYSAAATVTLTGTFTSAGSPVGTASASPVAVSANQWTRLNVLVTATASYDGFILAALETTAGPGIGATVDATGALVEVSQRIETLTNYVENTSFETLSSAVTGVNAVATRSSVWSADQTYSLSVSPNSANNYSYAVVAPEVGAYLVQTAQEFASTSAVSDESYKYFFSVTFNRPTAATGTLNSRHSGIVLVYTAAWNNYQPIEVVITASNGNQAGQHTAYGTFSVPSDIASLEIRLVNGTSTGNGDIYFDKFLVSSYDSYEYIQYFNGSTPASGDYSYAWLGTANNSRSVRYYTHTPKLLPYFDGDSVDFKEWHRNHFTNPNAASSNTGWSYTVGTGGTASAAHNTGPGVASSGFVRTTWTVGTSAPGTSNIFAGANNSIFGLSAATRYSAALWVRPSRDMSLVPGITFYSPSNTNLGGSESATVVCRANEWTQLKVENALSPANTYYAAITARISDNTVAGDAIDTDQAILVAGPSVPDYFDGSTKSSGTQYGKWLGTANASQSSLLGPGDALNTWLGGSSSSSSIQTYTESPLNTINWAFNSGTLAHGAYVVGSVEYINNSMKSSLRIVPNSDTNNSYVDLLFPEDALPVPSLDGYTVYATLVVDKAQTGILHTNARQFAWMSSGRTSPTGASILATSTAVPNIPGRYEIKWIAKDFSTTPDFLRLYCGSSLGNGDLWLERISVVPGTDYILPDPYHASQQNLEVYQTPENQSTKIVRTGISEVYTNNASNPEFASIDSTEPGVLRTNYITDPRGTSIATSVPLSVGGWGLTTYPNFAPTAAAVVGDGPEGRREFLRITNNPAYDPRRIDKQQLTPAVVANGIDFEEGQTYTYSVWVRVAESANVFISCSLGDGTGYTLSDNMGPITYVPANVWTRLSITFLVHGPVYIDVNDLNTFVGLIQFDVTTNTTTQVYDFGSALLERTDKVLPYFDGSFASNAAYTYGWNGATNAARSSQVSTGNAVLRINEHMQPTAHGQIGNADATTQWRLTGAAGGTAAAGFKPGISDAVFIYSVAGTSTNTATITTLAANVTGIPVVPDTQYAFSADVVSTVPLPNGARVEIQWKDASNSVISTSTGNATAISVTGTYQNRSILVVAPSTARFAVPLISFPSAGSSLVVGSAIGGTAALFEATNKIGTFFSGDTSPADSLNTVAWNGVRNFSSSSLIDARRVAIRTNYAREAIPLSTATTRWSYVPGAGETNVITVDSSGLGMNQIPGFYQVTRSTYSTAPATVQYSEKISGVAGDTYTGSMAFQLYSGSIFTITTYNLTTSLTFKKSGVVVNSASAVNPLPRHSWAQLFAPSLTATSSFDEIVISVSGDWNTSSTPNQIVRATQALIEKTSEKLPWFDANNPVYSWDRVNLVISPSMEASAPYNLINYLNEAQNSGPWSALSANGGTWSSLPPLGATITTQFVQNNDGPPYGAPNFVRNIWTSSNTSSGEKGFQYLQTGATGLASTYTIDIYARSSIAAPVRIVVTTENSSNVVQSTSFATSATNMIPGMWTRLRATVASSAFERFRIKVLLGDSAYVVPAETILDVSSVMIRRSPTAISMEYVDSNLPDSDFRDYQSNNRMFSPYYHSARQNFVLDPTLQYGAADWKATPGWGTGGTGTANVELGKGLRNGYSLVRRWTSTPSNSTSVSGVGAGYMFHTATTGTPYSFIALYSGSKDTTVDSWVTWYTDNTMSTVVERTRLSSYAYTATSGNMWILGENVIAPFTAGFGLFTVGTYDAGFNPQNGDWFSVSNMRIDEGFRLVGGYFDMYSFTGTDNRYQVDGDLGNAETWEMGANGLGFYYVPGDSIGMLDKTWASSGYRSLRVCAVSSQINDSYVYLNGSSTNEPLIQPAPYARTFTISGTVRVDPDGHHGPMHTNARRLVLTAFDGFTTVTIARSEQISASATAPQRVSLTGTVPAGWRSITVRLYNGGRRGAGDVWWDDILVEQTDTLRPYFSGDSPPSDLEPGKKAIWAGAPNGSPSRILNLVSDYAGVSSLRGSDLIGTRPYTVDDTSTTIGTQSWRGPVENQQSYVRVTSKGASSDDTYVTVGGQAGALRLGMQQGKVYTALGRVVVEKPHVATHVNARRMVVFYKTSSSPNVYQQFVSSQASAATGTYDLRMTFTVPTDATEAFLALYNGSKSPDESIYWTNVALVPGYYREDFFTGSWVGAANASSSVVTAGYPGQVYGYGVRVLQSEEWSASGGVSLKLIPNGSEDSYAVLRTPIEFGLSSDPALPSTNTTPRVVFATIHIEDEQLGTLSPYARSIVRVDQFGAKTILAQAPNVPGTYALTATIAGTQNVKELRLYNGSTGASGSAVWWDNFAAIYVPNAVTTVGLPGWSGGYFDGSRNPEINANIDYTWLGETDYSFSQANEPGSGTYWPYGADYYADKVSAITTAVSSVDLTAYFDGRTSPTSTTVYYYTGADEQSSSTGEVTVRPAVNTYFDGNTGGAFWNGPANMSTSTLPGLSNVPKATIDVTFRSAWIE